MVAFRGRDPAAAIWRHHVQRTGEVVERSLNANREAGGRPESHHDA
jgi:hypothetical protein